MKFTLFSKAIVIGLLIVLSQGRWDDVNPAKAVSLEPVSVEMLQSTEFDAEIYLDNKVVDFRTAIYFSPSQTDLHVSILANPREGYFHYEKLLVECFDAQATTIEFSAGIFYDQITLRVSGLPEDLCRKSVRSGWKSSDLVNASGFEEFVREVRTDNDIEHHLFKIVFQGVRRVQIK
jgi:hypothetical protein